MKEFPRRRDILAAPWGKSAPAWDLLDQPSSPADARTARSRSGPLAIALVIESSSGGSMRHVVDLAVELVGQGHNVVVFHGHARPDPSMLAALDVAGVERRPVDIPRRPDPLAALACLRWLRRLEREGGFDLVHAHSSLAGFFCRTALRRLPVVYTPHAFATMNPALPRFRRAAYTLVERLLGNRRSAAVICVSAAERRHAAQLGLSPPRLHTVVNGGALQPLRPRAEVREDWGVPEPAFVFGFLGRLCPQKAPDRFVHMIADLAAEFPHTHGVIVGDGELAPALRQLAAQLGVADRIRMAGYQAPHRVLAGFDCLAMTSRYEAMPYVLIEALGAGLPLLSTAVGGAEEAIAEGGNGYSQGIDPTVGTGLATAARKLVTGNRPAMSRASLERARAFAIPEMVRGTLAVYRHILSGAAGAPEQNL